MGEKGEKTGPGVNRRKKGQPVKNIDYESGGL